MNNAESILDALRCGLNGCDCKKALPGKGHVHCPLHQDINPSFSVVEKDGKTLVHCQANCAQDLVIAALEEKGLWPKPTTKKSSNPEIRYGVRDVDDQLVAVHVRKESPKGKKMWWEQPDGTNGLNGMPVSSLPLYGSEDLQQLPDGSPVVVTEGGYSSNETYEDARPKAWLALMAREDYEDMELETGWPTASIGQIFVGRVFLE